MICPAHGVSAPHTRVPARTLLVLIPVVSAVALVAGASAARVGAMEAAVPAVPCLSARPPVFDPERIPLTPAGADRSFSGYVELVFASSPFGVTVSQDGHSVYDVELQIETARRPEAIPTLVAWATTPNLDQHVKLGVVGDDLRVQGRVEWNKFLVFVTAEASPDVAQWQGPILLTAMSPSGWMHTMAGHGIFEGYAC